MAELIGVISGAITFGTLVTQLAASINKLKDYWEQVRDAPEDLKWLIRDIEMFGLVLSEIEDDAKQESVASSLANSKSAMQSFKLCKEASEELEILVRDLGRDVDSSSRLQRSYAALKITMQKNKLEKYRSRLKNVTSLLMLSQQCYTRALIQTQHELITKKLVPAHQPNNSFSSDTANSQPIAQTRVGLAKKSKNQLSRRNDSFKCQVKVPVWMRIKSLEIAGLKAPDGWKFTLRTFNTIPHDSKAVRFAWDGNIKGLQDLFAARKASPFDRVENSGATLLHYASILKRPEVIEFLLNQGADPSIGTENNSNLIPLRFLLTNYYGDPQQFMTPSMRLLLSHSETIIYDTPEETINGILQYFRGTAAEFKFLQQECCPGYYQMSQSTRIFVTARIFSGNIGLLDNFELLWATLGTNLLSLEDFQFECFSGFGDKTTLAHIIAGNIGRSLANLDSHHRHPSVQMLHTSMKKEYSCLIELLNELRQKLMSLYKSWNSLFCELLSKGYKIHERLGGMTPFSSFLTGYFTYCLHTKIYKYSTRSLKIWLNDLRTTGLDLKDFGQVEERFFKNGDVYRWIGDLRLINFTYGPSPDDWHLWVSEVSDSFAGDFWDLVQRQEDVMPGAWPDDAPYKM